MKNIVIIQTVKNGSICEIKDVKKTNLEELWQELNEGEEIPDFNSNYYFSGKNYSFHFSEI